MSEEVCWYLDVSKGTLLCRYAKETIRVTLADDRLLRLKEIAAQFEVSLEELVRVSIEELVSRPEEEFERAVNFVLQKNAELYRRLV